MLLDQSSQVCPKSFHQDLSLFLSIDKGDHSRESCEPGKRLLVIANIDVVWFVGEDGVRVDASLHIPVLVIHDSLDELDLLIEALLIELV